LEEFKTASEIRTVAKRYFRDPHFGFKVRQFVLDWPKNAGV
jgi:hypothetical protein